MKLNHVEALMLALTLATVRYYATHDKAYEWIPTAVAVGIVVAITAGMLATR